MKNIQINHLLLVLMYYQFFCKHQFVTGIDHNGMDYQTMKVHYYVTGVTI